MALCDRVLPAAVTIATTPCACSCASSDGRHVVADQDVPGHALGPGGALVQVGMDAADHMVKIVHAALEVRIVHAVEHRGQAVALQAQGVIGGIAPGTDQFVQAVQQFRIVEQQRMQVEEFADFLGQRAVQALAQQVHLAAGGIDRFMQALQFAFHRIGLDPLLDYFQCMRKAHPRAAKRAAARGAVAREVAGAPVRFPRRTVARTGPRPPPAPRLRLRHPRVP